MDPSPDPLGLTASGWEALAGEWSLPRYRGRQIFDALHRRGVSDYAAMRELPKDLRDRLTRELPLLSPEIVRRDASEDGSAKYGLRLADGALVEAVFMPGEPSRARVNEFEDARAISEFGIPNSEWKKSGRPDPKSEIRNSKLLRTSNPQSATRAAQRSAASQSRIRNPKYTVCLSSQTGCAVDCAFCVTGRLGGGRNLSAGEILGQLYAVQDDADQTAEGLRIVFMGMGEPFLNPEGVLPALDILFEILSPRRVTVSTSGITPAFETFAARPRRPNLAVSVNAADQETRARLMPITRTYPLEGVVRAMRAWPLEPRRRITAEYVLIAGANDSVQDARRLARLLSGIRVKVNLIPLNEDPRYLPGWRRPEEAAIDRFARCLVESRMAVTVRRSRGPDAGAACGQLKGRSEDVRKRRAAVGWRAIDRHG